MRIPKSKASENNYPVNIVPLSKLIQIDNSLYSGLDVKSHCIITGYVAQVLYELCSDSLKEILSKACSFYAAAHDVGKISPAFQKMIYQKLSDFDISEYPELKNSNSELAKRSQSAFHGKVSQVVFETFMGRNSNLAIIEGMHHGFRPNTMPYIEDAFGGDTWTQHRHKLIEKLKAEFLSDNTIPEIASWEYASVIGGFITVSDWIASGGCFSELTQSNFNKLNETDLHTLAESAVEKAGFVSVKVKNNLSFEDIFGFKPRETQSTFINSITSSGVYILEAPMGLGKTEAALFAAYKLLEAGCADGIYFGLPTQLTSNKIYERVKQFLCSITNMPEDKVKLKLLHSMSWLEDKELGEDAGNGKAWFDDKKRGILAPFAVGTVDQALMSVMNIKHGMVRAFGLAGKVVILDEVHSYDSYTGTILNSLVEFLKSINTTVIVLSATLSSSQKRDMLKISSNTKLSYAYPLVTKITDGMIEEFDSAEKTENEVVVQLIDNRNDIIDLAIQKAESGEQILWIENTVNDAQNLFKIISGRCSGMNIECGLIHSRYIKTERKLAEEKWTHIYGKNGSAQRKEKGRILIGTQVLEQSLDIDSDLLVTRICPSDMLLQRIGRLWRHKEHNSIRPKGAECKVIILSPLYSDALKKQNPFGLSAAVYSEYLLFRTLEIWEKIQKIKLPYDIRTIIEKTYEEREETGKFSNVLSELRRKRDYLKQRARIGLSAANKTLPESMAETRYSESENIDVLILKSFAKKESGYVICFWNSDEEILLTWKSEVKKRIAKNILEHTVTVSAKNAPPYEKLIEDVFSPFVYTGNEDEHPFRVAVLGNDGFLQNLNGCSLESENKKYIYDSLLGYQISKQ